MKKLLTAAFALALSCASAFAQNPGGTIDTLTLGVPLLGNERIPMFQFADPAVVTTPAAIKIYAWQGNQTIVGTFGVTAPSTATSGFQSPIIDVVNWVLGSNSTATVAGGINELGLSGSANVSATGRAIGGLNWVNDTGTGSRDLTIGTESRFQNSTTSTYNNMPMFDANVAALASGSTITSLYGLKVEINSNTGTITNFYGVYVPDLSGAGTITNRWALFNADANAQIQTAAPIIAAVGTEVTGAKHQGIVSSRYYWGVTAGGSISPTALSANTVFFAPYFNPQRTTYTKIGCRITTLSAANNLQMAIYKVANGVPTTLLVSTSSISTGATGIAEATISQQLEAGMYMVAVNTSGTPSINFYTENAAASIGGTTTDNGGETALRSAQTFNVWPNSPSITYVSSSGSLPQVWLRK